MGRALGMALHGRLQESKIRWCEISKGCSLTFGLFALVLDQLAQMAFADRVPT